MGIKLMLRTFAMRATTANMEGAAFNYGGRAQKLALVAGASALTMIVAFGAVAPARAQPAADASVEEIIVTGTRIVRDGYEAPTPLTVIGEAEIAAAAPANVADFVNDIPSMAGSATPQTNQFGISAGNAGINALNLRALGATRTLVLLDGQRSVGSTITGSVDVNTFPQGLIKGVEIVTGGASAAYGSDAVSGVVNFILDKELVGVKGSVEYGQTTYGDNDTYRINLSAGIPFAEGRGKVLLNGEISDKEGIVGTPRRDWNDDGWYIVPNPAYVVGNGQPEWHVTASAGLSNSTPGGIITAGPFKGTAFGPGGVPYQQVYGYTRDPWMVGGDWDKVQVNDKSALDPEDRRKGIFGRVDYDLTDNISIFGQASYNEYASLGYVGVQFNQGNITLRSDNAFLPANIRTTTAAATNISVGSTNADMPIRKTENDRNVQRYVVGARGDFDVYGQNWKWDAYAQRGETNTREAAADVTNNARLALAQDAVFAPNGSIVCRSTLTAPTNGCVPFNRLGIGVNSPAALAYIIGSPWREQTFVQDVAAANFNGEPFSVPAGPVSVAFGIEHRREKVSGNVPLENRSGWFVGNFLPTFGKYSVTEGYVEAVVPIIEGLDFNGAVRVTDYSTSGTVTTWKAGATYSPIEDIRLRVTRSRDIRAPNLNELFAAGTSRTNQLVDPFRGNQTSQFLEVTTGNLNLDPEVADTIGLGFVLQPRFAPGLGLSVDYYNIKIKDAIGSTNAQVIVDRCFNGLTEYCAVVQREGNVITRVNLSPFNFAERQARGVDVEASYRFTPGDYVSMIPGSVALRAVATFYLENYNNNGIDPPTDSVGQNAGDGPPDHVYRMSATWTADPWVIQVTGRGVSKGVYDNSYVTCTTSCPRSTAFFRTISSNSIDGAFYVDTSFTYKFDLTGAPEVFLSVQNLLNKDPKIVAYGPAGTAYGSFQTNPGLYDTIGRNFRMGVRFKY
jgi:iron complex outermembrane recepter protein